MANMRVDQDPAPPPERVTFYATASELRAVYEAAGRAIERGYWCAELDGMEICFSRDYTRERELKISEERVEKVARDFVEAVDLREDHPSDRMNAKHGLEDSDESVVTEMSFTPNDEVYFWIAPHDPQGFPIQLCQEHGQRAIEEGNPPGLYRADRVAVDPSCEECKGYE